MNNLIKLVASAPNQTTVVDLLIKYNVFDFVRNYLMDYYDIDYTDHRFIDEQNILSLSDIKHYVIIAITVSIS